LERTLPIQNCLQLIRGQQTSAAGVEPLEVVAPKVGNDRRCMVLIGDSASGIDQHTKGQESCTEGDAQYIEQHRRATLDDMVCNCPCPEDHDNQRDDQNAVWPVTAEQPTHNERSADKSQTEHDAVSEWS